MSPHGQVGKAYVRTFKALLIVAFVIFMLVMGAYEVAYHPNGIAPL